MNDHRLALNMGDFILTAVKGVVKLVAVPVGFMLLIAILALLLTSILNWLYPALATGKLVQREQAIVDLAGQTPVSVTLMTCAGVEKAGEVIDGKVRASFPVCEGAPSVSLRFQDFEALCALPYMSSRIAAEAPWRFRIVDRKCELIYY